MKLLALTSAFTMSALAAAPIEGFTHVRTVGGIAEYKLESNGLRVLMLPQPAIPTATFMVTYHVGSRNEVTGTTGSTHLLEHLMFKGTTTHHRGVGTSYDQVLERVGAMINATTWLDRTNYFATVPVNALPLLIELEADRMRNLSLHDEDRRPEMTVVRNEFELGENNPMDALGKEIWSAAFQAHPYHHDTIGWRSDIENVPTAKLREFYDTFYWPDNATATVIGGFDARATLQAIKEHYGRIPKSPHPFPKLYTKEPEQTGQRRVQVKRSGELGIVTIAHKIPEATHADWPAIEVLSNILAHGDTSRCFRTLTDKNLTIEVDAWAAFTHDPSLHLLTAELADGVKHETVERELVKQIELIKTKGVTANEVQTSIAGFLAHRAFSSDGSFALANEVNDSIAVGDWTLYVTLEDKIKAVKPADVQRVAKQYFIEERSTVGWFVPTNGSTTVAASSKEEHFEPKDVVPPAPLKHELAPAPTTDFAHRIQRTSIAGADVLVCPSPAKDIVSVRISLPVGEGNHSNRALAHLTADMVERGTTKHDKFEIADMLESAGVDIESKITAEAWDISAKCLSKDLPMTLDILAEQWLTPVFKADEFAKAKKDFASTLQQSLENVDEQASIAFTRAMQSAGHPLRNATVEEMAKFNEQATLADVKSFYQKNYGPVGAHIVIVGDADAKAIEKQLSKLLSGWKPQPNDHSKTITPPVAQGTEVSVPMADKSSVTVIIGQPTTLRPVDHDWLALQLANEVLGNGFTSRLVGNVRDREGLTYNISSDLRDAHSSPTLWMVKASFAPTMLDKGIASTRREIAQWQSTGITAEELAFAKTSIAGQFTVGLETTAGLAGQLMVCILRGHGTEWLDQYPSKINALTLEDVNRVIKTQLDPAKMALIKAGVPK